MTFTIALSRRSSVTYFRFSHATCLRLRFFVLVADAIQNGRPPTAEKLRRASPHWMRHTHASHALVRGAELIMVRDNLRHASISTASTCLHSDAVQRVRQFNQVFAARK
ncbi:site-specific recombinase XerD [Burkholderia ambifaria]|nr:site-specific recombinase XerD [Burkholderia ambifaria]